MHTVRCVSMAFLRCGLVRFKKIGNLTVRFGAIFKYWKSYGAVPCCDISYGAVRCGSVRFSDIVKPTVRCDAVFKRAKILRCGAVNRTEPHRTDRKNRTVKNPDKYRRSYQYQSLLLGQ